MTLSSSDIGTDPVEVENTLKKHFRRAKIWDAMLLIDEADVFLEKRATATRFRILRWYPFLDNKSYRSIK
jgi:hypothetical protein